MESTWADGASVVVRFWREADTRAFRARLTRVGGGGAGGEDEVHLVDSPADALAQLGRWFDDPGGQA